VSAIYLCFDDRFAGHARACLNSLRSNFPGHPPLLVDYRGRAPHVLSLVDAHAATRLHPAPPPEFTSALRMTRGRDCALHRFGLWRRGLRECGPILHLDADTLVLGPLDDLFEASQPVFVANHEADPAVRIFAPECAGDPTLLSRLAEDGLDYPDAPDDMANAGVFLLPPSLRTRPQMALLARLAQRYGAYFAFADQSLLSLWLRVRGIRPSTDFSVNFQTPFFTDPSVDLPFEAIRVLHFSSARKPGTRAFSQWSRAGPQRERLTELFHHYRDMTP